MSMEFHHVGLQLSSPFETLITAITAVRPESKMNLIDVALQITLFCKDPTTYVTQSIHIVITTVTVVENTNRRKNWH